MAVLYEALAVQAQSVLKPSPLRCRGGWMGQASVSDSADDASPAASQPSHHYSPRPPTDLPLEAGEQHLAPPRGVPEVLFVHLVGRHADGHRRRLGDL